MKEKKEKSKLFRAKKGLMSLIISFSLLLTGCGGTPTGDGESVVEKSKYGILVMNQNGEVVPDAQVVLGNETKTTNSNGSATFVKPENGTVSLTVSCKDYYTNTNNSYQVLSGASDVITIKSKSLAGHHLKSAVYQNGPLAVVDLVSKCKKVNMSTPNMTFTITASVLSDADQVSQYELYQMANGTNKLIATTTTGTFANLKVSDFSVGTNVYITVYDRSNHQTSTSLNFQVGEDPNMPNHVEMALGDEALSFTIANENIPIFGGTTFSLGLPKLPADYKVSNDTVRVGFNVDEDTFDDDAKMDAYKEILNQVNDVKQTASNYKSVIKSMKRHQKRNGLLSMSGFDKGIDFSVSGYAEAGYDSMGQISTGTGCLCISMTASAEFDWQFVVWVIPITVGVKGEVTADLANTVSYSFVDNKFTTDATLTITPSLTVKAGVGFQYLSAGVYGDASLETQLVFGSLDKEIGFQYVDLTSSIGVYGTLGPLENESPFVTGTMNLWTRNQGKTSSMDKRSDGEQTPKSVVSGLYDLGGYSPITKADPKQMTSAVKQSSQTYEQTLARDISSAAVPVMAAGDNTAFSVFCSQQKLGTADATYSKLYYTFYQNGWRSARALDSPQTNQMNPQIVADGDEYYLMYQETSFDYNQFNDFDSKTTSEKKSLLVEFWKSVDIHVQKYNADTGVFTDLGKIVTPQKYDYNYSMVVKQGVPHMYWATNANGDVFGTDTASKNAIMYAKYSSSWSTQTITTNRSAVTHLAAGIRDNKVGCAFALDGDNDLTTTDDRNLAIYVQDSGLTKVYSGTINQLLYDTLPNSSQAEYLLANEKGLSRLSDNNTWEPVLENVDCYTGEYAVADQGIYYSQKTEKGSEIYGCYPVSDGYSDPVQITSDDQWQRQLCAGTVDGYDLVNSLSETYSYSSDGAFRASSIISNKVNSFVDMEATDFTVPYNETLQAGEIPVEVTLTNKGNVAIPGVVVEITDRDGNVLPITETEYSCRLNPGEIKTLSLHITTQPNTSYGEWKLEAVPSEDVVVDGESRDDVDTSNNRCYYLVGRSDFVLSTQICNSGAYPYALVEVKNAGNISDAADLSVTDANDLTKEWKTENTGNLDPGVTKVYKVNLDKTWADSNGQLSMLARITGAASEMYTYNNYAYEYATLNYGTYQITYQLNGGVNGANPATYTTVDHIELEDPVRSGYSFVGWYTDPEFATITQVTQITSGTAGNLTLYAKWAKKTTGTTKYGIKLNAKSTPLQKGKTVKLIAQCTGSGNKVKNWISSNKKIATVSKAGKVKGKSVGTAYITVRTSKGYTANCKIKVQKKAVKLTGIKLSKSNYTLIQGRTAQIKATKKPIGYLGKITYRSKKVSIVTVTKTGKVKAKKKGSTVILVKCGKKTAKVKVAVK